MPQSSLLDIVLSCRLLISWKRTFLSRVSREIVLLVGSGLFSLPLAWSGLCVRLLLCLYGGISHASELSVTWDWVKVVVGPGRATLT